MSDHERISDIESALVALHERVALLEAAQVKQHQILQKLTELLDSLHRRLSRFRDAMGPQPPLSGEN